MNGGFISGISCLSFFSSSSSSSIPSRKPSLRTAVTLGFRATLCHVPSRQPIEAAPHGLLAIDILRKSDSWAHSLHFTFPMSFPRGPSTDLDLQGLRRMSPAGQTGARTKSDSVRLYHTFLALLVPRFLSHYRSSFSKDTGSHNGHMPSIDWMKAALQLTGSGSSPMSTRVRT